MTQILEFSEPEPLVFPADGEEGMPLLSPDGRLLYFTRSLCDLNVGGRFAGSDIWVAERSGGGWPRASNIYFPWNDEGNNAVVGISEDGNTLYLMSTRGGKKTRGLYFSKRSGTTWTKPELIPIEGIAQSTYLGFYVSPRYDVILISMRGEDTRGQEDLYVSLPDGRGGWSKPRNLGVSINSSGYEISPFLSSDKKRLYFSSNGRGGLGDADIFVSERLYDSWEVWTAPKNLGEGINSKGFDGYFSIYGDSVSYVVRTGAGLSDMYRLKVNNLSHYKLNEINSMVRESQVLLDSIRNSSLGSKLTPGQPIDIFFRENSADLLPSSVRAVRLAMQYLEEHLNSKLRITYSSQFVLGEIQGGVGKRRLEGLRTMVASSGIGEYRVILHEEAQTQAGFRVDQVRLLLE